MRMWLVYYVGFQVRIMGISANANLIFGTFGIIATGLILAVEGYTSGDNRGSYDSDSGWYSSS